MICEWGRTAALGRIRLPSPATVVCFPPTRDSMDQPDKTSPTPRGEEHMLGHGFYNKHSHEQGKANTYGLPLIIEAINQIDLPANRQ
jgi:hypothetical protein